jgi:hypothetical protein
MQAQRRSRNVTTQKKEPKLSRTHAPADLSPVEWQRGLRRQFGREQAFGLENLTSEPFFSEFRVSNPDSKSSYRVAIRGRGPGGNFCSCPDYATSELGTCKHIEFTLARLEKKRGAKAAFARGSQLFLSSTFATTAGAVSISGQEPTAHQRCAPLPGRCSTVMMECCPMTATTNLNLLWQWRRSRITGSAPMTMRSISSREGGMRRAGPQSSRNCFLGELPTWDSGPF